MKSFSALNYIEKHAIEATIRVLVVSNLYIVKNKHEPRMRGCFLVYEFELEICPQLLKLRLLYVELYKVKSVENTQGIEQDYS